MVVSPLLVLLLFTRQKALVLHLPLQVQCRRNPNLRPLLVISLLIAMPLPPALRHLRPPLHFQLLIRSQPMVHIHHLRRRHRPPRQPRMVQQVVIGKDNV